MALAQNIWGPFSGSEGHSGPRPKKWGPFRQSGGHDPHGPRKNDPCFTIFLEGAPNNIFSKKVLNYIKTK